MSSDAACDAHVKIDSLEMYILNYQIMDNLYLKVKGV